MLSFHPTPLQSIAGKILPPKVRSGAPAELKRYWMVLLKKGPVRNQDTALAAKIQRGHMDNINRLSAAGKLVVAGPFENDETLRGIFIMDCKDSLEVVSLVDKDPAVVSGRLIFEVKPWWTVKNCMFK
ncbi:YCII-related domain-containing protein [Chitinophaga arvensicola]|uniref:YCII-related domain-containing protein n=2 Tax=Chitinophaga arvensicola TaxID=29529 RepID=A0A1I0SBX9_9BACT|nr:YCII-related domain-containing protein [Chitinophaga arvensicola]